MSEIKGSAHGLDIVENPNMIPIKWENNKFNFEKY